MTLILPILGLVFSLIRFVDLNSKKLLLFAMIFSLLCCNPINKNMPIKY